MPSMEANPDEAGSKSGSSSEETGDVTGTLDVHMSKLWMNKLKATAKTLKPCLIS